MAITAAMVKQLRDKTGAGMMDSKKALTENDGDMDAAEDWLRSKGIAKADKKAGRTAAEGLVGVSAEGGVGAAVEVNSETDFVARNAEFQDMVGEIASVAQGVDATGHDVIDAVRAATVPSSGKTVEEHVKDKVGTIGENMTARRAARLDAGDGVIASYVHNAAASGMGKIGVLVAIAGGDGEVAATIGKQIAMHIAASAPLGMTADDIDPAILEREKRVLVETAKEAGKSEAGIESWSEKQLAKFKKENALLEQKFVMDSSKTVAQAIKAAGDGLSIASFVRLAVGEGIEKEEEDFAAEVAKTMGG